MKRTRQKLPDCDLLFERFFVPWYSAENLARRRFTATLPDALEDESFVGLSRVEASPIGRAAQSDTLAQIGAMVEKAQHDWPRYIQVSGEIDLAWIDQFDRHFTRERIRETIDRSDPGEVNNRYLLVCSQFGAVLGRVLLSLEPRLFWRLDSPYWDSTLLDPKTGTVVAVFHWAIKKMSEYGVEDGYAAKVRSCLEFLG
jgi:hypothetical protein